MINFDILPVNKSGSDSVVQNCYINMSPIFQKAASELALKKKRELQRNEFQPPKTESEDETDDELENDVDLTKYVLSRAQVDYLKMGDVLLRFSGFREKFYAGFHFCLYVLYI